MSFRAYNFRQIHDGLATSGVIAREEFPRIAEAGFRTVIDLLPIDNQYAIEDEAKLVGDAGMAYVHIPIDIEAPTAEDFERFEAAMDEASVGPVWVHCAANWRVSAFVGLYARLHLDWSEDRAGAHMREIWEPTAPWLALIDAVIATRAERPR